MRSNWIWVLVLCVTTVLGFLGFGKASFALWMTSHPLHQSEAWATKFNFWFFFTIIMAVCWICSIFFLWKQGRRGGRQS
jgi:heme/copper-type cytochrome/quinol oxidase subunit 2